MCGDVCAPQLRKLAIVALLAVVVAAAPNKPHAKRPHKALPKAIGPNGILVFTRFNCAFPFCPTTALDVCSAVSGLVTRSCSRAAVGAAQTAVVGVLARGGTLKCCVEPPVAMAAVVAITNSSGRKLVLHCCRRVQQCYGVALQPSCGVPCHRRFELTAFHAVLVPRTSTMKPAARMSLRR